MHADFRVGMLAHKLGPFTAYGLVTEGSARNTAGYDPDVFCHK
jgi:hypothetical protein